MLAVAVTDVFVPFFIIIAVTMLLRAVALALAGLVVERLYAEVTRFAQGLFAFTFAGVARVVVVFYVTVRLASSARASTLSVIVDCDVFER